MVPDVEALVCSKALSTRLSGFRRQDMLLVDQLDSVYTSALWFCTVGKPLRASSRLG